MVLELDTSGQGYKTTFTLHSTNVWNKVWFHCKSWKCRGSSNECIMWAVNSADFWRGGWQLQASFSQSILLQFWKSQCPSGSKYPEFSKTPPAFAFWMSLKVVVAIFPRNDIFFGTLCRYLDIPRQLPCTWVVSFYGGPGAFFTTMNYHGDQFYPPWNLVMLLQVEIKIQEKPNILLLQSLFCV